MNHNNNGDNSINITNCSGVNIGDVKQNISHKQQDYFKLTGSSKGSPIFRKNVVNELRSNIVLSAVPLLIGVTANLTSILQYFDYRIKLSLFLLITLFYFALFFLIPTIVSKSLNFHLWFYLFRQKSKNNFLLFNNHSYFLTEDGACAEEIEFSTPCTYPGCKGTISLYNPPPSASYNHKWIGCCSIDRKKHTYSVDENLIATKCSIDWRPISFTSET